MYRIELFFLVLALESNACQEIYRRPALTASFPPPPPLPFTKG